MSGGADALAGAVERMYRRRASAGEEPALMMSGGAAVKLAPITELPFETVDTLIFEGCCSCSRTAWRSDLAPSQNQRRRQIPAQASSSVRSAFTCRCRSQDPRSMRRSCVIRRRSPRWRR